MTDTDVKSAGAVGMAVGRVTAAGIGTTGLVIAGIAVAAGVRYSHSRYTCFRIL